MHTQVVTDFLQYFFPKMNTTLSSRREKELFAYIDHVRVLGHASYSPKRDAYDRVNYSHLNYP